MRRTKLKAWDYFWQEMAYCDMMFGQAVEETPERAEFLESVRRFQESEPSIDQIYFFSEACSAMHKFTKSRST